MKILKQIVAHLESISLNRGGNHRKSSGLDVSAFNTCKGTPFEEVKEIISLGLDVSAFNTCKGTPFEEVKEIISLPAYNSRIANNQKIQRT